MRFATFGLGIGITTASGINPESGTPHGSGWQRRFGFANLTGCVVMGKWYTVSDGKLVLNLEEAEEGGYVVTSPLDPGLITQAETLEEAFVNARDAAKALKRSRARLMRQWELAASKKPE